jgi:ADP-ribosylglycohydrolase
VALSVGSHRLDVIKHRALRSSDFPHHHHLIGSGAIITAAATGSLYHNQ